MKDFERIDVLSADADALEKAIFHELERLMKEADNVDGNTMAGVTRKFVYLSIANSLQNILMEKRGYDKETHTFKRPKYQ